MGRNSFGFHDGWWRRHRDGLYGWLIGHLPKRNIAVFTGYPPGEGNCTALVREAARSLDMEVVWLDPPAGPLLEETLRDAVADVTLGDSGTLFGLWSLLRARAVFFTHQVRGLERASRKSAFVAVWHGDGMKRMASPRWKQHGRAIANYVVSTSRVYAPLRAWSFGVPTENAVVTGNPRNEYLREPADASRLAALGLDPERKFVLWLPTHGAPPTPGSLAERELAESLDHAADLASALTGLDMDLVVKKHPLARAEYGAAGIREVTDRQLEGVGLPFYSLLGAAAGLVTDASSVMVDYLMLDRPVGFILPDAEPGRRSSLVYPEDIYDRLPGPLLHSRDTRRAFAADVAAGGSGSRGLRAAAREYLGLVFPERPARMLLEELARRGAVRLRT